MPRPAASAASVAPRRRPLPAHLVALLRACALIGVSLALLAPSVRAQTGEQGTPSFAVRALPAGLTGAGLFGKPALGDLDGDGDLDVLVGSFSGDFVYFRNTAGPGAAAVFERTATPAGLSYVGNYIAPALADLDGDGDLDVLVGNEDGNFVYFRNTAGPGAAPVFELAATPAGLSNVGGFSAPAVTDLDGDGKLDVLAGNRAGNFVYFRNTGTPTAPAFELTATPTGLSSVGADSTPALADLDGDGDLDVLAGNSASFDTKFVYFENTAGASNPPQFAGATVLFGLDYEDSFPAPALGDLNGDGTLDMLAGGLNDRFFFFANTGPVAFAAPTAVAGLRDLGDDLTPTAADLDGDGDLDLLAGRRDGNFLYLQNTAGPGNTPAFAAPVVNPFGLVGIGMDSAPAVADFDGDGDLDVLSTRRDDYGFVYFRNTAGPGNTPAFAAPVNNPFGLYPIPGLTMPQAVDLDGDGDLDLLLINLFADSHFAYFENTAGPGRTPVFAAAVANPYGLTNTFGRDGLAVVDHDGDGDLDVIVLGGVDGTTFSEFRYFENTAGPGRAPIFVRAATPTGLAIPETRFNALTAADLDGDGDADLLTEDRDIQRNPVGTFAYFRRERVGDRTITAALTGTDGYRMLAAPSATTSIAGLLGPTIYTQGFPGATEPGSWATVYRYDETAPGNSNVGYVRPGNASEAVGIGQGLFVLLFADEDPRPSAPGQQGGFPKTLTATGRPALVDFDWGPGGDAPLSFTDTGNADADGWNLLGNPFASWFDWDAVDLSGVNAPVYVYDNEVASYRSHTRGIPAGNLNGGVIGPFQGFWAQANAAGATLTARPAVSSGGPLLRGAEASAPTVVGLRLRPGAGSALPAAVRSEAFLVLGVDGAEAGVSPLDAFALVPASASYVLLATEAATPDGGSALLAIDVRPTPTGVVTVELDVSAVLDGAAVGSALVLDWPELSLPAGWSARLLDRETGAVVDLGAATEHPFTLAGAAAPEVPDAEVDALALATTPTGGPRMAERTAGRFALEVTPSGFVAADGGAAAVLSLSAARPNPTAGAAALTLVLPEVGAARVSVVDMLGREVAVLADGTLGAGPHVLRVAPGVLAAGTYVVRAAVGGRVLSQRLTVTR